VVFQTKAVIVGSIVKRYRLRKIEFLHYLEYLLNLKRKLLWMVGFYPMGTQRLMDIQWTALRPLDVLETYIRRPKDVCVHCEKFSHMVTLLPFRLFGVFVNVIPLVLM